MSSRSRWNSAEAVLVFFAGIALYAGATRPDMAWGDSADFAAKLALLFADPELRARLGERARREVLAHYTWEANVRQLLAHLAQRGVRLPDAAPAQAGATA